MTEINNITILFAGVLTGFSVGIGSETAKYLIDRYIRHRYDLLFSRIEKSTKNIKKTFEEGFK